MGLVWLHNSTQQIVPVLQQIELTAKRYDGKVPCPPKKTFEEFTTNPVHLAHLKRLYSEPDEVGKSLQPYLPHRASRIALHLIIILRQWLTISITDLLVGLQLDETNFPGTIIPTSKLILSLINLFRIGDSDRFSPRNSLLRCIVDNPFFNCHPSNILGTYHDIPTFHL